MKLGPRKCQQFRRKFIFVGCVVSEEGYIMDPAEVAAVQALKEIVPVAVVELRKMLGFSSYYRAYIPNFYKIAKPLYTLLTASPETVPHADSKKNRKITTPETKVTSHQTLPCTEHTAT